MVLIEALRNAFNEVADQRVAIGAAAYMKDQFQFFGVSAQPRRRIIKAHIQQLCSEAEIDWPFIFECFEQDEREFQYTALDYLRKSHKKLRGEDLPKLKSLIKSKSWWDSVDHLATEVGVLVMKDHQLKGEMLNWATSDHLWVRRVAIIHQLKFKSQTDEKLLAEIIELNLPSKEFFINKAIGWALRAYSAVDPKWVIQFCETHDLAALSRKEALRKIKRQ